MEIQKLKASMQMAEMRHKAVGSEETAAVLEAAQKAYADALGDIPQEESEESAEIEQSTAQPVVPQVQVPVAPKLAPLPKVVDAQSTDQPDAADPEKKTEAQS
ncbi:hypothetical protein [Salmonirosea aquatica]|uniref:Uncharacterized protein n=1 Tax=Salmonirosea aquatica TaxID=2654236 RepID=A0A7C9FTB5_9BACT|nr:hypothetical protein [Cytophagaceae bacterium SJW1-29]